MVSRSILHVLTEAVVDKIIFDKSAADVVATGVQYTRDGRTETSSARKEVVLLGRATNLPRLLKSSDIGSAESLKKLIEVVVNNPGVGENLQNHVMVTVSSEVRDGLETMSPMISQDHAALAAAQEGYVRRTGPLATSGTCVTGQLPFPGTKRMRAKRSLSRSWTAHLAVP